MHPEKINPNMPQEATSSEEFSKTFFLDLLRVLRINSETNALGSETSLNPQAIKQTMEILMLLNKNPEQSLEFLKNLIDDDIEKGAFACIDLHCTKYCIQKIGDPTHSFHFITHLGQLLIFANFFKTDARPAKRCEEKLHSHHAISLVDTFLWNESMFDKHIEYMKRLYSKVEQKLNEKQSRFDHLNRYGVQTYNELFEILIDLVKLIKDISFLSQEDMTSLLEASRADDLVNETNNQVIQGILGRNPICYQLTHIRLGLLSDGGDPNFQYNGHNDIHKALTDSDLTSCNSFELLQFLATSIANGRAAIKTANVPLYDKSAQIDCELFYISQDILNILSMLKAKGALV